MLKCIAGASLNKDSGRTARGANVTAVRRAEGSGQRVAGSWPQVGYGVSGELDTASAAHIIIIQ